MRIDNVIIEESFRSGYTALAKRKRRAEKSNSQSIRKKKARFNFDFRACLGDDVTQNASARHCARETQLFLA